ncbi:MAG: UDP-4-amino-4,6-dideoxy-N-acetyl-beta-L-altrosamine transaminase [Candidatus Marinimicrobia bacterium]|nr:UDP-4-amino-4,6-dideoxy-N-acetyl-beta-L-altrosamine transaminase [Candidatus Neomarinimicrobiota bacterium]|tara:strand:- start:258 stop:1433 length:1176 start_codon:yes stop_codon:yes gene_type:complete
MASNFIPFSRPDISELEIQETQKVLKSGWLSSGPTVKKFEKEFQSFISEGSKQPEAIAVNSATAGLHLALESLGIGAGDEIITTTLTFTATAAVARHLGAEVRLVDIDERSLNIDTNKIEDAITSKTKAIVPVHYAGLSCEMDTILAIAKNNNLKVIEDAAHALPTRYNGHLIGNLNSDATVFSFYANKTMTTGEGGMVLTHNSKIAERIKIMRSHGINRDAFDRFTSKSASWYYEVISPGYKYNLTDLAASIGRVQLERLPKFLLKREKLAARYIDELKDLPLTLPENPIDDNSHAWHLFVIRLEQSLNITRDTMVKMLNEENIGTSVHYVPLHTHPYWKQRYGYKNSMFKVAQKAYENMISIPLFSSMTDNQQLRIIEALRKILLKKQK